MVANVVAGCHILGRRAFLNAIKCIGNNAISDCRQRPGEAIAESVISIGGNDPGRFYRLRSPGQVTPHLTARRFFRIIVLRPAYKVWL